MKILFGSSRNSTCYVDINTFFRVSSNLIHFHCSPACSESQKIVYRLPHSDWLLFFLLPSILTVGNPERGEKTLFLCFPLCLSVQLPLVLCLHCLHAPPSH